MAFRQHRASDRKKCGIVVLDADDGGLESLARLERAGAPVPRTAKTRTGGGDIEAFEA